MPISTSANAVTSDTPTWHRCHAGVPLNDKWSKMVRTFDVHDGITGLPLPGSPLSFIFGDQDTKDKWPALVQAKLKASGLDAYLRLGTESAVDGDIQQEGTVDFWQIDQPLRVFIGGFEETERAARWSCALHDASGADMTLAQALEASIQPPSDGSGKCTVQCTLRDQATRRIIRQWNCELAYDAADNLLARIDTLASSIEANIQVRHAVHDHGKALKARGNMKTWTLRLPTALGLELTLANAPTLWTACHSGIPLNDKWSKMVRTFDVHDGLTGLPLPGSPLSFIFGDQDTKDKWPAMVQAKLKASGLDAYLRLGTESAVDGDIQQEGTVDFWQIDQPLRVFIGGFEETERAARWSCALRDASGADMTLAQAMEASIRPPTGGSGKCTVQCTLRDQTTQGIIRQWTCELAYEASDDPLARIGTLSSSIEANIHVRHVVHDFGKALTSKNDKASWTLQLPADLQLELTLHPAGTVATAPLYEDLPDMTGFEDDTLGADDCLWASRTYVLADRDLLVGEKILAWAVDPIDGRLLKSVTVTGTEENRARAAWPAALVRAIQADKTWVAHSVLLQAGHVSPDAELAVAAQSTSSTQFAAFDVVKKATVDRLWAFDSHCRVFSNAPFKANQVAAVRLPQAAPAAGDRVCVQIRHRTSQWLYESHVFTPHPKADQATWSEPLCEFLNTRSSMLRAGQLAADGITISPGKNDNTLWIPQLSELSVHVESIGWLEHEIFTPSTELTTEVVIAVHDDVTGAPLPGSPFKFTPSTEFQSLESWPAALAEQLATSELAEYLKFEKNSTGKWTWWRAGVPLRIWMNAPFGAPDEWDNWGHDVEEVLRRMIESNVAAAVPVVEDVELVFVEDVELVIESHDARTGLLCHHSTIARTALSSDPSKEKKLVELKRYVAEHLKANGIFGGASSIGSGQGSGLPLGGRGARAPLARLVTTLTIDSTERSEPEKLELVASKHLASEHVNTQTRERISQLVAHNYRMRFQTPENIIESVKKFMSESSLKSLNKTNSPDAPPHEHMDIDEENWHLPFWYGPKSLYLSDIAERVGILKEFTSQKSSKRIPKDQRLSLAQQNTQISIRLKAHLTDPDDIRFIKRSTEISAARQVQAINRMEIIKYLPPHAHVNFTSASIGIPTTEPVPKALSILLDATAASQGFGFISCRPAEDGLSLGLHASFEAEQDGTTAGIRVGITSSTSLWEKIQACTAHQYIPTTPISNDTLCADMANTQGSALFATTPSQLSGVSAQTGLFHAHYPIATLCGLSGKGPSIDLGLNYSPLRANESGLGDGWAFTFSSYDNRSQVLALSNGTVDELTANDIKVLLDPAQGCLIRGGYTIKNAAGNSTTHKAGSLEQEVYALTGLTIEYLNGRQETLTLPQDRDGLESGVAYKKKITDKLNAAIKAADKALEELAGASDAPDLFSRILRVLFMPLAMPDIVKKQPKSDSDSGVLFRSVATLLSSTVAGAAFMKKDLENLEQVKEEGKKLTELKRRLELRIKDIDREALTLVTENIESPQGGTLKLSWQGLKGHVRLKDIKDGNTVLVQVRHSADPVLEGSIDSTITVWPDTPECFVVKLDITNCLLRTLTYSSRPQANTFDKRVHFNYGLSPILDYVLIGVAEDDGSLEVVDYEHGQLTARKDKEPRFELYKSSPRVALHTIVPGGHQPNVHHAWKWEGGQSITAAIRYQHAPVGSDLQYVPFTRWEWSSNDKGHLQLHQQIDEIPGEQRRTTLHVYQTDSSVPSHLRRAQQTEQIVTLEDLRASKPAEEQQP